MRPGEIDYSSRAKHYFDISNGEVLAGKLEMLEYKKSGADPENIHNLGTLLRQPAIELPVAHYEGMVAASEWTNEQYKLYGRWLFKIVDPPSNPHGKKINETVLKNSWRLGVGPGLWAIERNYGTTSNFYREAGLTSVQIIGEFNNWEIDDYVRYVRKVGGDTRPKREDFNIRSQQVPGSPDGQYIKNKFKHIGGFKKILELAGYPVIDLWEPEDYVEWGVKFMEANDGTLPTSQMVNYFSKKKLGPSDTGVIRNFDYFSAFQNKVAKEYYTRQSDRQNDRAEKLVIIRQGIDSGKFPEPLFKYNPEDPATPLGYLDENEVIVRFAKFIVLQEVAPAMEEDTKVKISTGVTNGKSFIRAIRTHHSTPAGDIEHAALIHEVYDDIWPMNDHITSLRLDEGFEEFKRALNRASNARANARRAAQKA